MFDRSGMTASIARLLSAALLPLALSGCVSLEQEAQPVIDSLHTEEMEAAIRSAQPGKPLETPPRQSM